MEGTDQSNLHYYMLLSAQEVDFYVHKVPKIYMSGDIFTIGPILFVYLRLLVSIVHDYFL